MQVSVDVHQHQAQTGLQSFLALADKAAGLASDMRVPEIEGRAIGNVAQPQSFTPKSSCLDHLALKDAAVLSNEKLYQKYGQAIADRAIETLKSQAPTVQQVYMKYQRQDREAKQELGRGLAAAGISVKRHSLKDYVHVIVTQLELLQGGALPSVSAVVSAAFPDDPKKATSIKNSQYGRRPKQAWISSEVMGHPMEKTMQVTHGKDSMNRRGSARTFGQSLSMNVTLFKSCDRITKLEARVQLLEQQMQATKNREALADAGATSSRDKVLSLYNAGVRPTDIANQLGMKLPAVKKALQRARKAA